MSDPVYRYVGWRNSTSPYGPLFTLASYGLAPLSVPLAFWMLKSIAAGASLGCVALVYKLARRLGRAPVRAAIYFGLNPIVLVWAVGGAHNDLLLMFVALAGVTLLVTERPGTGLGALVGACAIKVWTGLILLFALTGKRDNRGLVVGLLAFGAVASAALAGFGAHALGFTRELSGEQRIVALHSVPNELGRLLGLGGITKGLRIVALFSLISIVGFLIARVVRGKDWVTSAGWATLCLLVCSAWLLPWYVVWVLPFAAVSDSPRLRIGTLVFAGYVVVSRIASGFG